MTKIVATAALVLCLHAIVSAQTCTGSLGDPALNETFGTGNYQLSSAKTTFLPTGGCPNRGQYVISGFLFGCGNHSWVQMVGDHTPNDVNGNYMMVNAESTPGTVYMDTAKNLCNNTVYYFGMWATPVMTSFACGGTPILPNIRYELRTLSGVRLAIDSTGYLPIVNERDWKFYGLSITTPPGVTDVIVDITINPAYGCGSGFAIDDITLAPCGPSISANIDGSIGPLDVCADYTNPMLMTASYSSGFADPVVQWQSSIDSGRTWVDIPGATTLTYAVPHRISGIILYRICIAERPNIASIHCRVASNVIHTGVYPLPAHKPPQNVVGCLEKPFHFPIADQSALLVLWSGPNGYSSTQADAGIPSIQYTDTGLYTLKETYYFGCVSLDSFYLKVFPGTTITVQPSYPICEGEYEQLFASATDSVGFQWFPATGLSNDRIASPIASPHDSTIYKIMVTNRYGCQDSALVPLDVYRNPVANAGIDKTILGGDTAILNGTVLGTAVNFNWTPATYMNDPSLMTPLVFPPSNTTYTLNVVSTVGCGSSSDNVDVKVYQEFFIPNAFTPNGDGKNDLFGVLTLDNYKLKRLAIYNRWGQVVFQSEGSYREWDGKYKGLPQPTGVYVYTVELVSPSNKKIKRQGTLTLTR